MIDRTIERAVGITVTEAHPVPPIRICSSRQRTAHTHRCLCTPTTSFRSQLEQPNKLSTSVCATVRQEVWLRSIGDAVNETTSIGNTVSTHCSSFGFQQLSQAGCQTDKAAKPGISRLPSVSTLKSLALQVQSCIVLSGSHLLVCCASPQRHRHFSSVSYQPSASPNSIVLNFWPFQILSFHTLKPSSPSLLPSPSLQQSCPRTSSLSWQSLGSSPVLHSSLSIPPFFAVDVHSQIKFKSSSLFTLPSFLSNVHHHLPLLFAFAKLYYSVFDPLPRFHL